MFNLLLEIYLELENYFFANSNIGKQIFKFLRECPSIINEHSFIKTWGYRLLF